MAEPEEVTALAAMRLWVKRDAANAQGQAELHKAVLRISNKRNRDRSWIGLEAYLRQFANGYYHDGSEQ